MKFIKTIIKNVLYYLVPKKNGYSNLSVKAGPAKGVKLRLDVRKEGSYWLGNYDQWIFDRIDFEKYIKPGDVLWDCGAYVGYYTAIFRKLSGENGKVYTFEASNKNYDRLKELPVLNEWSNVHIYNMAVGPDHTELEFVNDLGGASGPYGLSKSYAQSREELDILKVKCCGVDELITEQNVAMPDFIKFDLESAEVFALHNGDKVFKEKRPVILLELHGDEAKKAAGLFFEKYNYTGIIVSQLPNPINQLRSLADFEKVAGVPHMVICTPNV
jgi:FkbM family methyltransferase